MALLQAGSPQEVTAPDKTITVPTGVTADQVCLVVVSGTTPQPTAPPTLSSSRASATVAVFLPFMYSATNTGGANIGNEWVAIWKATGVQAGDTFHFNSTQSGSYLTHYYFDNDFGVSGAIGGRAGVSQAFQTAPAITVAAGARVTLFSIERTSATGTTVSSIVNSNGRAPTTLHYRETTNTSALTSHLIADWAEPTTGSGTTTVTYSGGSTNGLAFHAVQVPIAVAPTTPVFTPTPGTSLMTATGEKPTKAFRWNGTTEEPCLGRGYPYRIDTLPALLASQPFYVAHRGGSKSWPEMTRYAYRKAAAWPMRALEISLFRSSDGVWVCSHDQSTLRVTGVDYDIPTTTWSVLSTLVVSASATNDTSQAGQPLTRLDDVLADFAKDHVIFVEDKSYANPDALLAVLDANGGPSVFVWKCYGPSNSVGWSKAAAKGYKTWAYYFNGSDMTSFASTYSRYDYLGLDYNLVDSDVQSSVATGKPCIAHILNTAAQRDRMLSLGCVGVMAADIQAVVPPQR